MPKKIELTRISSNLLLAVLLATTTGTVLGFSSNMLRGYVVIKFCFVVLAGSLCLWGAALALASDQKLFSSNRLFFIVLLGMAASMALSVAVSSMPLVSLFGSVPRMMGALTYWAYLAVAAGTVVALGRSASRMLILLRLLMVIALVVAIHTLVELPGVRAFRPPGLLGNPDFLGNWFLFIALSGFTLMIMEERPAGASLAGAGSSAALICIVFTQTRGAWLGMVAGTLLFFGLARLPKSLALNARRRTLFWAGLTWAFLGLLVLFFHEWGTPQVSDFLKRSIRNLKPETVSLTIAEFKRTVHVLSAMAAIAVGALLVWAQIVSRWPDLHHGKRRSVILGLFMAVLIGVVFLLATSTGQRIRHRRLRLTFRHEGRSIIWRDTVKGMIPKVWYKGCGIETFRVAFLPHKSLDLAIDGPKQNWRNPHNIILYELSSNGIFGLVAFLMVVAFTFTAFLNARRRAMDRPLGLLMTGCMASFAGYLFHNLVNYDVVATGFTMYLFVGLAQVGWTVSAGLGEADRESPSTEKQEHPEPAPSGRISKKKGSRKRARIEAKAVRAAPSGPTTFEIRRTSPYLLVMAALTVLVPLGVALAKGWTDGWGLKASPIGAWADPFLLLSVPLLLHGLIMGRFLLYPKRLWSWTGLSDDPLPRNRALILSASHLVFWLPCALLYLGSKVLFEAVHKDLLLLVMGLVINLPHFFFVFVPRQAMDPGEAARVSTTRFALISVMGAALLVMTVFFCRKHLVADWSIHRAQGIAKAVDRKLGALEPQLKRINDYISRLKARQRQDGANPKEHASTIFRLEQQKLILTGRIEKYLDKVVRYGRIAAGQLPFMGFYHHQYSKALQPFVREQGVIPSARQKDLLEEAVRHASKGVINNSNPESAYSHLAVIHFWSMRNCSFLPASQVRGCQERRFNLSLEAVDSSISHDRYYFDTHRMKAFLLLRRPFVIRNESKQRNEESIEQAVSEMRLAKRIIKNDLSRFKSVANVDHLVMQAALRDGISLMKKQRWAEALEAFKASLQKYGEPMPEAHHFMATALTRLARFSEAEQELRTALKQRKDFPQAYLELARVMIMQQRIEEAHRLLDKLLVPSVKLPAALLIKAYAFETEQRIVEALAEYRRYLEINPKGPQADKVRQKIQKLSSQ